MLVHDPRKRLTMSQICQHPWMLEARPEVQRDPLMTESGSTSDGEGQAYNDHVLHLMHSLNIDEDKTVEVGGCWESLHPYM